MLTDNQLKAKKYLQQIYNMNEMIKQCQEELAELRVMSTSIPSMDFSKERVSTSRSNGDANFAIIVGKIIDKENYVAAELCNLLERKFEIRSELMQLPDVDELLVLKYRYVDLLQWEEICDKMNKSNRTINRYHDRGLTSFYNMYQSKFKKVG